MTETYNDEVIVYSIERCLPDLNLWHIEADHLKQSQVNCILDDCKKKHPKSIFRVLRIATLNVSETFDGKYSLYEEKDGKYSIFRNGNYLGYGTINDDPFASLPGDVVWHLFDVNEAEIAVGVSSGVIWARNDMVRHFRIVYNDHKRSFGYEYKKVVQ